MPKRIIVLRRLHRSLAATAGSAIVLLVALSSSVCRSQSKAPHPLPFEASERLQLVPIQKPLKLAEPNLIPAKIAHKEILQANASWGYYNPDGTIFYPYGNSGSSLMTVDRQGGQVSLSSVPPNLGKLELTIFVAFRDGGFASGTEDVQVGLPDRKPEKLIVTVGGVGSEYNINSMSLDLSPRKLNLNAAVHYEGYKGWIDVPARFVAYKILASSTPTRPITLDPPYAQGISLGRALVELDFSGLSTLTCIQVVPDARYPPINLDCTDLLPPDKSFPAEPTLERPKQVMLGRPK